MTKLPVLLKLLLVTHRLFCFVDKASSQVLSFRFTRIFNFEIQAKHVQQLPYNLNETCPRIALQLEVGIAKIFGTVYRQSFPPRYT